jgi:hypothetical protein
MFLCLLARCKPPSPPETPLMQKFCKSRRHLPINTNMLRASYTVVTSLRIYVLETTMNGSIVTFLANNIK